MADPFLGRTVQLESPGGAFAAVSPDNDNDLPFRPRYLIVGTAGTISCVDERGVTTSIPAQVGVLPIRPVRIRATGTTAAGIVACW